MHEDAQTARAMQRSINENLTRLEQTIETYRGRCWALLPEDLRVGRFGPPFSSPQEPHYRDEVEGPSHVQDEVPRCELAGL